MNDVLDRPSGVRAADGAPPLVAAASAAPPAADFLADIAAMPGMHLLLAPDAPRFTVLAASDEHLAASLVTREATIGHPLFAVFPDANPANPEPSGVTNLRASLELVLHTRAPHRMAVQRYDVARPDSTWVERYWEPMNVPVLGPTGDVQYIVHRVEDVTARVQAEAELARVLAELTDERERLRSLIRHMPAPVALLVGPEHRVELVNAAFRQLSGREREVTGLTLPDAFPTLAAHGFDVLYDQVFATGEPWAGPETLVRLDRGGTGVEDTWFDLRLEPVRDAAGRVTAVLNFAVDVTDQVRARQAVERLLAESEHARAEAEVIRADAEAARIDAEAAFAQAQAAFAEVETARAHAEVARAREEAARAEAEAANAVKMQFLATMSHELRTPLNAIGGYTGLLEMGLHGPVTDEQRTALERIQRSQRHLLGLINGVLNYARLEAGTVHYDLTDVALDEVLATSEALTAPQVRAKHLTLRHDGCEPALRVRADREKLQQVLLNLLSNAIKFTEPGGHVALRCLVPPVTDGEAGRGRIYVQVTDSGIGIPVDQQERIFEPFVQVDAALTRTREGTGLGLAISRDLARGMGGDLRVRSRTGEGSTFTVTLRRVGDASGVMADRRGGVDRREDERRRGGDRRDGFTAPPT